MKGLDIFLVRFAPFVLYLIFGVYLLCCWLGIEGVTLFYELHSNSVIYPLVLFLISLANKKYHCIWNRAMYVFLIAMPIFNFADACIFFIESDLAYLISVSVFFGLTALITAYLAIRHFVSISKKKIDNERR